VLETPQGVEATLRQTTQGTLLFVLNHQAAPVQVALPSSKRYRNLLRASEVTEKLLLEGYDVAILAESEATT
jgi:beta-galactosidase